MTTREEMALAFAKISYEVTLTSAFTVIHSPGQQTPLSEEDGEKIDQGIVKGAVEMADLLLKELSKADVPYPTGQVPLPTDPGEGWRFVEAPLLNTDQYWLHGKWNDYTTENCNRDFKSGEVGAYYCPIRRKINMEPQLR